MGGQNRIKSVTGRGRQTTATTINPAEPRRMSTRSFVRTACLFFCIPLCLAAGQQPPRKPSAQAAVRRPEESRDWTLGEFRKTYLGQRILILQGDNISGSLGGWQPVKQGSDGSFHVDLRGPAFIDFHYKDQTPAILAIQQSSVAGSHASGAARANVMGEAVSDDDAVDPFVDVFVRFDDGQVAKYSNVISNIRDRYQGAKDPDRDLWDMPFMLVADRDAHARIIARNLPAATGQKLYAVSDSLLFGPDLTPEELLDIRTRDGKKLQDVPLLVPMIILGAKYSDRFDFIAWKLRLPDGREIVSAARYRDDELSQYGNDNSFLGRSIGTLLQKIPPPLTQQEVAAIRSRKIFRGMSRQAVFYSWGITGENNYGRGGRQLVYSEHQFVYLDSNGKVTDSHSLAR
jgi:hypothetical protein